MPRRNEPDDMEVDQTGTEAPMSNALVLRAGGATNDGAMNKQGETPVDPAYDGYQLNPYPATMNAILPYFNKGTAGLTLATGSSGAGVAKHFTFRINSIYDILFDGSTYSADPTPAAQAADGTLQFPIMRPYYASLYQYWTVVKADYTVNIWSDSTDNYDLDIWCYHHGQQMPPITNTDNTTLWSKYRKFHKHCHMKRLKLRSSTQTEIRKQSNRVTFHGTYHPGRDGSVHNEVSEDAYSETWHKISAVPKLHENVTFIIQKAEHNATYVGTPTVEYDIEIVYYVQFKDLAAQYQYITPLSAVAINPIASQVL